MATLKIFLLIALLVGVFARDPVCTIHGEYECTHSLLHAQGEASSFSLTVQEDEYWMNMAGLSCARQGKFIVDPVGITYTCDDCSDAQFGSSRDTILKQDPLKGSTLCSSWSAEDSLGNYQCYLKEQIATPSQSMESVLRSSSSAASFNASSIFLTVLFTIICGMAV